MASVKRNLVRGLISLFGLAWLVVSLMPFYLMLLTSLKSTPDYATNGFFAFPKQVIFTNYLTVVENGIFRYFRTSILIVASALILLLLFSMFAAYPLSRMRFRLCKPLTSFIIACMAVPMHVTLIPIFLLTRSLGLYDKPFGLIIPYVAFNIPITVFILTSFMQTIPREMEDAAWIDGCNLFTSFHHVIVPLTKAGLVTVAIYDAISMWNEFSFALVLTQSESMRTLPLAVWNYKGQYGVDVPMMFCVLMLSVVPMIIAFAASQEKLVKGMMAGALKG